MRAAVIVVVLVGIYFLRCYIVGALALVGAYYLLKLPAADSEEAAVKVGIAYEAKNTRKR